jgi:hypothetical protein
MTTNISVGHRPCTVMAEVVRTQRSPYGTLASVYLMTDRETSHWHGCGCVAMTTVGPEVSTILDHTEPTGRRVRCAQVQDAHPSRSPQR